MMLVMYSLVMQSSTYREHEGGSRRRWWWERVSKSFTVLGIVYMSEEGPSR